MHSLNSILLLLALLTPLIYWDLSISIEDITQPPLCNGNSCIDRDPRNAKCDADAQTHLEQKIENTIIQLRYSARCHASWAAAIVPPYSLLYVKDKDGKEYGRFSTESDGIAAAHFGNMGSGRNLSACIKRPQDNQAKCTTISN
jgi:Protein of unknown function (DUF2690)